MVYGQEKLIPDEKELDELLNLIAWAWDTEEMSAKQIAKELKFGEPEPEGYPNLKPYHVYYFVQRYGKEYGMYPRKKIKKEAKEEKQQAEAKMGVLHTNDMPYEVAHYLRERGLLVE